MARPQGACGCCGKPGVIVHYTGWRWTCYMRWYRAGMPAEGPPEPRMTRAERIAEYKRIHGDASDDVLAERLGVSEYTIRSYKAELRRSA